MTTRKLTGFAPLGRTAAVVLSGMLFWGSTSTANAEDKSHESIQGTWRVQVTVRDCQTGNPLRPTFPALFAFAKGGTASNTTGGQFPGLFTSGLGVWGHTEGNTYQAVLENFVFSPAGVWIQTNRFTHTVEVADEGDRFTDTIKVEFVDTTGNVVGTGCGTGVASRFELTQHD